MKILQINKFFYPKGGAEAYFFDLCRLLEDHGHEVIHFSMKHPQNVPSKYEKYFVSPADFGHREGLPRDLVKLGRMIYSTESKSKLEQLIIDTKPDVAHLHNISHQLSPSILTTLKKYNIPVVQTLHDYQLICPNYKLFTNGAVCERCKVHKYYESALNKCVAGSGLRGAIAGLELAVHQATKIYENNVGQFITPSKFLREKLIDWGKDPKQIITLANFFDYERFTPSTKQGEYVLFAGRLIREKGIMVLAKAAAKLPHIKFKIVGDGEQRTELELFIKQNNLQNIELLGFKSREDVLQFIAGARFIVLPSIWYENYSIALLEAAALGKAVIATNIGGNPEIVLDGKTGLLVPPGDADLLASKIDSLYNDRDLIRELGIHARKKLERDNNKIDHYQRLMAVYKQQIGARI